MRLLFDQNLSRRLVGEVAEWFPDSVHVGALGLDIATDREIWDYAGEHGYLIVFQGRRLSPAGLPPRTTPKSRVAPCRQ